jgi:serine protease Do
VVIAPDGYILTNHRVVRGAGTLVVSLPDGSETTAQRVGEDAATDLAVLRAAGSGFPYAVIGESSRL